MDDIWKLASSEKLIALAIEEDLGDGDITSLLTIPEALQGATRLVAKEAGVVCGLGVCAAVYRELSAAVQVTLHANDGDTIQAGAVLAELSGPVRALLSGERIILNFLQRLSGIATCAAALVADLNSLAVYDTRKTTPGWRQLEKYAVRVGGARNHRMHLGDMILIKDNHADLAGRELGELVQAVLVEKPAGIPVEVEVRTLAELQKIAGLAVDAVLLDNMDADQISECLQFVSAAWSAAPPRIEVSGGVTRERLKILESQGVPSASVGALTTTIRSLDISMLAISPSGSD